VKAACGVNRRTNGFGRHPPAEFLAGTGTASSDSTEFRDYRRVRPIRDAIISQRANGRPCAPKEANGQNGVARSDPAVTLPQVKFADRGERE
jgi:hypothetical protein